jgi:hypothetical protein
VAVVRASKESFKTFLGRPYFDHIRQKYGSLMTPALLEDVRQNRTFNKVVYGCLNCSVASNQFAFLVRHLDNKPLMDYVLTSNNVTYNLLGFPVESLIPCLYHLFESFVPNTFSPLIEDQSQANALANFVAELTPHSVKERYDISGTRTFASPYFFSHETFVGYSKIKLRFDKDHNLIRLNWPAVRVLTASSIDWVDKIYDAKPTKKRAVSREEARLLLQKIRELRDLFFTKHDEALKLISTLPFQLSSPVSFADLVLFFFKRTRNTARRPPSSAFLMCSSTPNSSPKTRAARGMSTSSPPTSSTSTSRVLRKESLFLFDCLSYLVGYDLLKWSQMILESYHHRRKQQLLRQGRSGGLFTTLGEDSLLHTGRTILLRNRYFRTLLEGYIKADWKETIANKT